MTILKLMVLLFDQVMVISVLPSSVTHLLVVTVAYTVKKSYFPVSMCVTNKLLIGCILGLMEFEELRSRLMSTGGKSKQEISELVIKFSVKPIQCCMMQVHEILFIVLLESLHKFCVSFEDIVLCTVHF